MTTAKSILMTLAFLAGVVALRAEARDVTDALKSRPVATPAFAADSAAKQLVGEWVAGGAVPGKVAFEELNWSEDTFKQRVWTKSRTASVHSDGRGGMCVVLTPDGSNFVTCVQSSEHAVKMRKDVPIAVLWEARTPHGGAAPYFRYDLYDANGKFVSATQNRSVVDPTQPQAFHRNSFVLTPNSDSRLRVYFHVTPSDPQPVEIANVRIVELGEAVADAIADDPAVTEARRRAGEAMLTFAADDICCGYPILPTSARGLGRANEALVLHECPGERVRGSVVLWTRDGRKNVRVKFSDLLGVGELAGEKLPAEALSAKVVKCHYQGEGAPFADVATGEDQVLVPELLLNDDALVIPDHEARINYVRFDAERPFYTNINTIVEFEWSSRVPCDKMAIRDASTLQPFDLAAGFNKQLVIEVKVPRSARAGRYRGKLTFTAADGRPGCDLPIELEVLPFNLPAKAETVYSPEREYTMGLYTWCRMSDDGSGAMSPFHRSKAQALATYRTLYENGIHDPAFVWPSAIVFNDNKFAAHLALAREAGFKGALHLGASGLIGNDTNIVKLAAMKARLAHAMELAAEYGFSPVYFYGFDEAYGDKLLSQRIAWQAAKEVGAKIIVSGGAGHFEKVGDLLDICVYHGAPENAIPADWHRVGHALWKYGTPQTAPEDPRLYRRNYGLYLWHLGFDGANTYCETSGGAMWNDLASVQRNRLRGTSNGAYRSETMLYPTVDGVVETMALAGLEAAIKDVRYLTKFRQLMREHADSKAAKWYESIDFTKDDPQRIRTEAIGHIKRMLGK